MKFQNHDIFSDKYNLKAVIEENDFNALLKFTYRDRRFSIELRRRYYSETEALKAHAVELMESCIEKLIADNESDRKLTLHHWFLEEDIHPVYGKVLPHAHGVVSGHYRLMDATFITTTHIDKTEIDYDTEEAVIYTQNSVYHCPLKSCNFQMQDKLPGLLPDYAAIKEKYEEKTLKEPDIEKGTALLVLSNHDEYYFNGFFFQPKDADTKKSYYGYPHIGTFQDHFLVFGEEDGLIYLAYFPHFQNICIDCLADKMVGYEVPFFIENIGDIILYVQTPRCGVLRLEPGERKEMKIENAEKEEPLLPDGDLYYARVVDLDKGDDAALFSQKE